MNHHTLKALDRELAKQRENYTLEHDDHHSWPEWSVILSAYSGKVHDRILFNLDTTAQLPELERGAFQGGTHSLRMDLIKIAALAISMYESAGRRACANGNTYPGIDCED